MNTYTIWFEIYGKKMRVDIHADSEEAAKAKLRDKIKFHKIEEQKQWWTDFEAMAELLGMKRKKPTP